MRPTALLFIVCQGLADQGPLYINGFPVDGIKLNEGTCLNEIVQMYDPDNMGTGAPTPNFADPYVCSRASLPETPRWESEYPGWYVKRVNARILTAPSLVTPTSTRSVGAASQ